MQLKHPPKNTRRPRYVTERKKKNSLLLRFRPLRLRYTQLMAVVWLLVLAGCGMAFEELRPRGVIINGEFWYLQLWPFLGALYAALRTVDCLFNSTQIEVTTRQMTVRQTPIAFGLPQLCLKRKDLFQFYVDYRRGMFFTEYVVVVLTTDQEVHDVISSTDPRLAQYFETCLEQYLVIEDIVMDGELDHGSPVERF